MPGEEKEQRSQIDEILSEEPAEEEQVSEEELEEEEQVSEEEDLEEEPEQEEEPEEEEPIAEEQEEEEPEEEEPDEAEQLRSQINQMSKKLKDAGLSIETSGVPSGEETEEGEEEQPSEKEVLEFMTPEELDELESNPQKMNEILNRVYTRAQEDMMKSIPSVIQKTTNRQIALRDKVRDFYEENRDLAKHRDFVGFVANEIESDNPDKDLDWVFQETSKEARKRLGLKKQAQDTETRRRRSSDQKPAFGKKPRGSRGGKQDTRNSQQKQIDQVIDL